MVGNQGARFRVLTRGELRVTNVVDLTVEYTTPEHGFHQGGNLWVFYDIRQFLLDPSGGRNPAASKALGQPAGSWTVTDLRDLALEAPAGADNPQLNPDLIKGGVVRTLDLYPRVPEFLYGFHIEYTGGGVTPDEHISFQLKNHPDGFRLPEHAIAAFRFWAVEDRDGSLAFVHSPADSGRYHNFLPSEIPLSVLESNPLSIQSGPAHAVRTTCPTFGVGTISAGINVEDEYGNPAPPATPAVVVESSNQRLEVAVAGESAHDVPITVQGPTDTIHVTVGEIHSRSNPIRVSELPRPNLYWGELHGMVFNQRPYREHFEWARDVARLDFAAGQFFSYNACVAETWDDMNRVWDEFDLPGRFVSLPAVEYGTPPDGSHRIGFFPDTTDLPPFLCEDRQAAKAPAYRAKYHPDSVFCKDYRALYDEVHNRGGFVHGHFHTNFYEREVLAEMYQKQEFDLAAEEEKINAFLQTGARVGFVAGSDTHDSRPANPRPEPGCPRPAGITGVWASRLDRASILDALRNGRCYATTGVRMLVDFRINGQPVGGTVGEGPFEMSLEALGTEAITRVEVVENGKIVDTFEPGERHVTIDSELPSGKTSPDSLRYVYVRVYQRDGNRAWSSPIWLEPVGA